MPRACFTIPEGQAGILARPSTPEGAHLEKLTPGAFGAVADDAEGHVVGSVQLTRPTIGGPLSWTSVRRPPPKVEVPENCWVWPFWVTCQVNAPPGWIVRAIEVSGLGCAFQVPEIVAPSGGGCWPGPGPEAVAAGPQRPAWFC